MAERLSAARASSGRRSHHLSLDNASRENENRQARATLSLGAEPTVATVLQMQRAFGNQFVQRWLASRAQAPSPERPPEHSSAPAPSSVAIQRKLTFTTDELADLETTYASLKKHAGKSTLFVEIKKTLKAYHAATDSMAELKLLQELEQQVHEWLEEHGHSTDKKDTAKLVRFTLLLDQIRAEVKLLGAEQQQQYDNSLAHTREARRPRNQRDPNADISKHFKYISETGAEGGRVNTPEFQAAKQNLGGGLTNAELAAIRIFSGGDFKYMNAVLSGSRERVQEGVDKLSGKDPETTWGIRETKAHFDQGGTLDKRQLRDLRKEAMQHSRLAQAGLAKLPDVVTNGYRGMSLAKTQLDAEYQVGNVVTWPGFNSTSTDRAAAEGYATTNQAGRVGVLLILEITSGKSIQAASTVKGEKEVLVLPGATFKVISAPVENENQVWEVHLTQVGAGTAV